MKIWKTTMSFAVSALLAIPALASLETTRPAPGFRLSSYSGDSISLEDFADQTVVVEWFAHDCEFTRSHYKKGRGQMPKLQAEFTARGVIWLTIDSNRNALPDDEMRALAREWKMASTAFLADPTGEVGRSYGVTNTPQMFVIHRGRVVYQGAIDDRSSFFGLFKDRSTAHSYVRQALEEVLSGKAVSVPETKPYGCSMKYAN